MSTDKVVLIRLPEDLREWLKEEAKRDERSFNSYCRRILTAERARKTGGAARKLPDGAPRSVEG